MEPFIVVRYENHSTHLRLRYQGKAYKKMTCHAITLHGHNGCTTLFMRRPQAENAINERGSLQDKRDRTYSHHHSE